MREIYKAREKKRERGRERERERERETDRQTDRQRQAETRTERRISILSSFFLLLFVMYRAATIRPYQQVLSWYHQQSFRRSYFTFGPPAMIGCYSVLAVLRGNLIE